METATGSGPVFKSEKEIGSETPFPLLFSATAAYSLVVRTRQINGRKRGKEYIGRSFVRCDEIGISQVTAVVTTEKNSIGNNDDNEISSSRRNSTNSNDNKDISNSNKLRFLFEDSVE